MGYFSFDDVSYAIFESNGKLSAVKSEKQSQPALPYILIDDGKIEKSNFSKVGVTQNDIENLLIKEGITIKEIEVLTLDEKGKIYMQKRNEKFKILTDFKENKIC